MSEKYTITDEDRTGKTHFNIHSINDLIITNNKLTFKKVSFDKSGLVNRPINIELLVSGIKIDGNLVPNSSNVKTIEFDMCILYNICIESNSTITNLKIKNSIIVDRFFLKNKIFNELNLEHSKFYQKVKIQECTVTKETSFFNTSFKELADFYRTKFNEVVFERADFEKISVFSEVTFNDDIDFKYVKFLGKAIFRDTVMKKKLNLRNTIFDDDANFLDVTSKEREKHYFYKDEYIGETSLIKVSNRETARIIKNFYDKSNNIIEANKFYALEMEKREKELEEGIKGIQSFFEYFIFKVHAISSNHSQDWILTLLWIINITYIYSISCFASNYHNEIIVDLVIVLIAIVFITTIRLLQKIILLIGIIVFIFFSYIKLDILVMNINPFSKIGTNMTYEAFTFKIIMAYLIYQFIVSVRQNTRRK